jgi:hypothetical protein
MGNLYDYFSVTDDESAALSLVGGPAMARLDTLDVEGESRYEDS